LLAYDTDLRRVPGPLLSRWSKLPLKYHTLAADRMHWVQALHEKYGSTPQCSPGLIAEWKVGPIVRIAPKEVAVADIKACKDIHKIGTKFTKDRSWYQGQSYTQVDDETCGVFGVCDPRKAAHRRKFFQQAGTKAAVVQWEDCIRKLTHLAVAKIKLYAERDGKVDIVRWWMMMMADISSNITFGQSFEILEKETVSIFLENELPGVELTSVQKPGLIDDIELTMIYAGLKMELPWLFHLIQSIKLPGIDRPGDVSLRMEKEGEIAVANTKAAVKGSANTLFSKMMPEDGEQLFSDSLMAKEAANIIIAGVDTTAMTLTYLVYEVLRQPEVKEKLVKELSTCSADPGWEELERKTYLNNVIQETMRRRPVITSLRRTTPKEGAILGGFRIPGDTTVATQAFSLHANSVAFPDPDRFDPDRWNDASPEMKDAFMPFGGSARVCVGQNVAKLALLHAVSQFFREIPNCTAAESMTEESMKMMDFFAVKPIGGKAEIRLGA
jgi:cytochrome P450